MKIFVKAKPNSKNEIVEQIDETHFIITVYFNVNRSQVRLVSGFSSKEKVFKIL